MGTKRCHLGKGRRNFIPRRITILFIGRSPKRRVGPKPSRTDPFHLSNYFHKLENHRLQHRHFEIIFSTSVVYVLITH